MRKNLWLVCAAIALGGVAASCDWAGGGDENTISDRYNWVNYSAVYRAAGGGALVSSYSVTNAAAASATNRVSSAAGGTAVAGQSVFGGVISHVPLLAGSVQVVVGSYVLTDNGTGALAGSGKSGVISYTSGAWSVDLLGDTVPAGTIVRLTYNYLDNSDADVSTSGGTSGAKIVSMAVTQSGNSITITDNNGATYRGTISSIRSTGGVTQNTPGASTQPADGDVVVGSFEASGTSAAGVTVHITGTLTGTVSIVQQVAQGNAAAVSQPILENRALNGTWIEDGTGLTGDINGAAAG